MLTHDLTKNLGRPSFLPKELTISDSQVQRLKTPCFEEIIRSFLNKRKPKQNWQLSLEIEEKLSNPTILDIFKTIRTTEETIISDESSRDFFIYSLLKIDWYVIIIIITITIIIIIVIILTITVIIIIIIILYIY
ncbi:hypothetical protein DDB_G0290515 [Dictyostelium discoideum AX4]|uniref:hypothetical protein n=1 Tax=Dictyostelium discoideum AX4 TaxID=352472 RepID=UPI00004E3F85|nr:hypothetical protein DDB_G0290515 [Dictyostelium discoideum AX4]EAL62118.1 hypothetical protein DDB_G0290515 [Dictyostelium discoideum AX4]|eukprot:XP_635619.1 hypothetical protein DDB_G0290515 [Dictyostelium discoideum AX4]